MVINMVFGVWYVGVRVMVSIFGGGFVLMSEVISLVGMVENFVVVYFV